VFHRKIAEINLLTDKKIIPEITRPSVVRRKLSHFNILIRNHWANCNQTLVEWSLDGPLPKLCPVIPNSIHDGRQAKNRKRAGV
jgi:hypothetical protein